MKKVYVSDKISMVLESLNNIDRCHFFFDTYYEKEVDDDFHVHVFENAKVFNNAIVYGYAEVCENAKVFDNAKIHDNAIVYDDAIVMDNAVVFDNAIVIADAVVNGNAIVGGNAVVSKPIINIVGLPFNVTLTDKHIQIGCKQFTFEQAKKLTKRNIGIDADEYNEIIKYKDLLLELIKVKKLESEIEK
jgi:carbonic anhydrase/acetyltransferase-like protein (isoleucine patch superfamily)